MKDQKKVIDELKRRREKFEQAKSKFPRGRVAVIFVICLSMLLNPSLITLDKTVSVYYSLALLAGVGTFITTIPSICKYFSAKIKYNIEATPENLELEKNYGEICETLETYKAEKKELKKQLQEISTTLKSINVVEKFKKVGIIETKESNLSKSELLEVLVDEDKKKDKPKKLIKNYPDNVYSSNACDN